MIAPIRTADYAQVPEDLVGGNERARRFHEWKASAVIRACVPLSRLLPAPSAAQPGILMYHRVVPVDHAEPTWNVTPERFRQQLSGLLSRGYEAWSLNRLIDASQNGGPIPQNVFVVTFDDGYANNLVHALPILQDLDVPATIFLATSYLGSANPFPFDDWTFKGDASVNPDTWRALTFAECHLLLDSGLIEFGSHTHTHEDFRNRPDAFRESLAASIDVLKSQFGIERPTLSLPYGIIREGFAGPSYYEAAQTAGATCCLTTEEEVIVSGSSPFGWGRFIAEQHDTASTLGVKLDGWRDAVRNCWRHLRGRRNSPATKSIAVN